MTDRERPRTTPEGHTAEEPRPSELGKPGTPGAGMTPAVPHPADADEHGITGRAAADEASGHRATDSHMDAHTALSDDDHGHAEPSLGPIDWPAWGFGLLGALAGVLVVALFWLAVSRPAA